MFHVMHEPMNEHAHPFWREPAKKDALLTSWCINLKTCEYAIRRWFSQLLPIHFRVSNSNPEAFRLKWEEIANEWVERELDENRHKSNWWLRTHDRWKVITNVVHFYVIAALHTGCQYSEINQDHNCQNKSVFTVMLNKFC
jgi:hypothetical protein